MAFQQLPEVFPRLPENPDNHEPWSANVQAAHEVLSDIYRSARNVTQQEDSDPLRNAFLIDSITLDAVNILQTMETSGEVPSHGDCREWLYNAAELLGELVIQLRSLQRDATTREDDNVHIPELVDVLQSGKRGRPRKMINLTFLTEATKSNRNLKLAELAEVLGVHRNTLRLYMKRNGIERQYSMISDAELDLLIRQFKKRKPESGLAYLVGHLRRRGLRIPRHRVVARLKKVDALGQTIQQRKVIRRRQYSVRRPNALWHVDGHHKLIRWGIVLHGFVDGFCRTMTGLQASTNNSAATVLEVFLAAVNEYGMPSRTRGDRGGENIEVAIYMVMKKGPRRASFIWGPSTRNTRIERMWVEVGTQFVRRWRAFFTRLERLHHLNIKQPEHLWLLHNLYLDNINDDCEVFRQEWNNHPISGIAANKSPADLRLIGQSQLGIYRDDCEGIHPDTIEKYYGVDTAERRSRSGAGHPDDESSSQEEWESDDDSDKPEGELMNKIGHELQGNVRHDAVKVPRAGNPFPDKKTEELFFDVLAEVIQNQIVPAGYGILPQEWDGGEYPVFEDLTIGKRGSRIVRVSLAEPIWVKRAQLWCQAISVLAQFNL